MKTYGSTILHLSTRWRWVVSFTPLQLYPRENNPWYALDRGLAGPQNRSGRCGDEKNLLSLPGIEPTFLCCPARTIVAVLIELSLFWGSRCAYNIWSNIDKLKMSVAELLKSNDQFKMIWKA
jgi:hypothetical protein